MDNTVCSAEADLVDKVRNGQNGAFNVLVEKWQQPIYRFLLRMITNKEEAEDLTQQVFISAYGNIASLKDASKFRQWIYAIAANKARDYIKTKKNNRMYSLNGNDGEENDTSPIDLIQSEEDTARTVQKRELADIVRIALEKIPPEQKDVVILKEYQGLTFEEIAKVAGCSVNTAKSRMYYGLKKLKEILEGFAINVEEYYENV